MARPVTGDDHRHRPYHSFRLPDDRPRSQRQAQEQKRPPRSFFPLWNLRRSLHAVARLECFQHRGTLEESHSERIDSRCFCRGEHTWDADVPAEAGARVQVWED